MLGPGNYKFMDFVRMGVPFTLLVMVVSVIAIPWFFPVPDDSKRYAAAAGCLFIARSALRDEKGGHHAGAGHSAVAEESTRSAVET